jgi:hypothetical protein
MTLTDEWGDNRAHRSDIAAGKTAIRIAAKPLIRIVRVLLGRSRRTTRFIISVDTTPLADGSIDCQKVLPSRVSPPSQSGSY